MADSGLSMAALDGRVARRNERREFFKTVGGAVALGGGLLLGASAAEAQTNTAGTTPTEIEVLNFALNLEYLEAEFYLWAVNGAGLDANLKTGVTTMGSAGNTRGGHQAVFTDPLVAQYAREIANDELNHVKFLRTALGIGSNGTAAPTAANMAVAAPEIDVSVGPNSAFTAVANAAGVPLNAMGGTAFDPYASDEAFLLGAFIFEDVGVTAYKGGARLINNKTYLEAAAGILAVEAYHAAIVRTTLYGKGMAMPVLVTNAGKISTLRNNVDNSIDDDQGIAMTGTVPTSDTSNIVPLDANGLAYSRTPNDVLNIAYGTAAAATSGAFFPNGVNGGIRGSSAFA